MTINSLDPSQKQALSSVTLAGKDQDLFLIYGPPGTGKSQLLVSMLFELALRQKRILFVSQNTEALQVIERMIERLEDDMSLPEAQLSLSDFCLKLYSKDHRLLKYIRGQRGRLQERRSVDTFHTYANNVDQSGLHLSYTKLNRNENNQIDGIIGTDELLRYMLRYVGTSFVAEPLRSLSEINVRQVLDLIDGYKLSESFTTFTRPQNALRFASTTNPELRITDLVSRVQDLKTFLNDESVVTPSSRQNLSVFQYLNSLNTYFDLVPSLDLFVMQQQGIKPEELRSALEDASKYFDELVSSNEQLSGLEQNEDKIFLSGRNLALLEHDQIKGFYDRLSFVSEAIEELTSLDGSAREYKAKLIIAALLSETFINIENLISELPQLGHLNSDHLRRLLDQEEAYRSKSAIARSLSGAPQAYREIFATNAKEALKIFSAEAKNFEKIYSVILGTNLNLEKYQELGAKSRSLRQIPQFIEKLPDESKFALTNQLLIAAQYAKSFDLEMGSTVNTLELQTQQSLRDVAIYRRAYELNEVHLVDSSPEEIIRKINRTIGHFEAERTISSSYDELSKYLVGVSSQTSFMERAPHCIDLLERNEATLQQVWDRLVLPESIPAAMPSLEDIHLTLQKAKEENLYSENFFLLQEGWSLKQWLSSVSQLLTFNNVHELDMFIEHNTFVRELVKALGDNGHWVEQLLIDPNLDFETFAARIVNTIVRASFQALPPAERPIVNEEYFSLYGHNLKTEKKTYYLEGLQKIKASTASSSSQLANANNWPAISGSTMDKIRANTSMISSTYPIVIATPKEVAKYLSPQRDIFDYVLFDEASQLLPGQALPAIFRAAKAVIIGDPHQMPPTKILDFGGAASSADDDDDFEASNSILDMVQTLQPENQHHLKVHYRSESNLLFEPSRAAIYAEDNIMPIFEAQMTTEAPIAIQDNLGWTEEKIDEKDKNFRIICSTVQKYLASDDEATFCILFTRADKLKDFEEFLATYADEYNEIFDLYSNDKILLSTVTKCQGIEGSYSILYLQHYTAPGSMWFFKENAGGYKRLNVAITRQRKGLTLLIADQKAKWLQTCENFINKTETGPNARKSAELLRSLLATAGEIADTNYLDKHLANNAYNFDSPLTEELYNLLCKHYKSRLGKDLKIYSEVGWHLLIPDPENIERNKRNIGFRIDLGIYSLSQQRFVLGIEMDGAAYHSGFDKEHSDEQRQKVLRAKGWELHRIWSTKWLDNQQNELDVLIEKIDKRLNGFDGDDRRQDKEFK